MDITYQRGSPKGINGYIARAKDLEEGKTVEVCLNKTKLCKVTKVSGRLTHEIIECGSVFEHEVKKSTVEYLLGGKVPHLTGVYEVDNIREFHKIARHYDDFINIAQGFVVKIKNVADAKEDYNLRDEIVNHMNKYSFAGVCVIEMPCERPIDKKPIIIAKNKMFANMLNNSKTVPDRLTPVYIESDGSGGLEYIGHVKVVGNVVHTTYLGSCKNKFEAAIGIYSINALAHASKITMIFGDFEFDTMEEFYDRLTRHVGLHTFTLAGSLTIRKTSPGLEKILYTLSGVVEFLGMSDYEGFFMPQPFGLCHNHRIKVPFYRSLRRGDCGSRENPLGRLSRTIPSGLEMNDLKKMIAGVNQLCVTEDHTTEDITNIISCSDQEVLCINLNYDGHHVKCPSREMLALLDKPKVKVILVYHSMKDDNECQEIVASGWPELMDMFDHISFFSGTIVGSFRHFAISKIVPPPSKEQVEEGDPTIFQAQVLDNRKGSVHQMSAITKPMLGEYLPIRISMFSEVPYTPSQLWSKPGIPDPI